MTPVFSLLLHYGADWVWDVDAFLAVAGGEGFDEFMLQGELVGELAAMEDDVKVDAGVVKGVEADSWLVADAAVYLQHDFPGYVQGYLLYLLQIAVIGYTAVDFYGQIWLWHTVGSNDGRGNLLVWYDNGIARNG